MVIFLPTLFCIPFLSHLYSGLSLYLALRSRVTQHTNPKWLAHYPIGSPPQGSRSFCVIIQISRTRTISLPSPQSLSFSSPYLFIHFILFHFIPNSSPT